MEEYRDVCKECLITGSFDWLHWKFGQFALENKCYLNERIYNLCKIAIIVNSNVVISNVVEVNVVEL